MLQSLWVDTKTLLSAYRLFWYLEMNAPFGTERFIDDRLEFYISGTVVDS